MNSFNQDFGFFKSTCSTKGSATHPPSSSGPTASARFRALAILLLAGLCPLACLAQLVCLPEVNINQGTNCQVVIEVSDLAQTGMYDPATLSLEISQGGNVIASGTGSAVLEGHVGQTLFYIVREITTNNSCWGTISVQDKLPPTIACPATQHVTANANCQASLGDWIAFATNLSDNCTATNTISLAQSPAAATLLSPANHAVAVLLTATDIYGNVGACSFLVLLEGATETCNGIDDDCNGAVEAATNTWTGAGDGSNWSDPANWSDGTAPLPCQNLVVPPGFFANVPTGFNAVGKTIEVATNAVLTVGAGSTLTIQN